MKLTSKEQQIHNYFSKCGTSAKEWSRKCILELPKIQKHEIWRKTGFKSIYEYAAKVAGLNHDQVREGLRIMNHAIKKPALLRVIKIKGINAVKPVAAISTPETAKFWASKAMKMSKHTLETYVKNYREKSLPGETLQPNIPTNKPKQCEKIEINLTPETARQLKKLMISEEAEDLIKELIAHKKQQIELEKPKAHKSKSRYIPKPIKDYVHLRSHGICEYPECTKLASEIHHTVPFSLSNEHNPDHLRNLCKAHHDIAHLGLIENENQQPQKWSIKEREDPHSQNYSINEKVQFYKSLK